jgi:glutathione S-transferase
LGNLFTNHFAFYFLLWLIFPFGSCWQCNSNEVTWADLYLLPIIADVMAIAPGYTLLTTSFPLIVEWFNRMKQRPSFIATHDGTLYARSQRTTTTPTAQ